MFFAFFGQISKISSKIRRKMQNLTQTTRKIGNSIFIREKMLTIFGWNVEIWAVQKYVNLVDLVKSFPMSIYLQKSASIQPRTSLSKFGGNFNSIFIRLLRRGGGGVDGPLGRGKWRKRVDPASGRQLGPRRTRGRGRRRSRRSTRASA